MCLMAKVKEERKRQSGGGFYRNALTAQRERKENASRKMTGEFESGGGGRSTLAPFGD
ncbi:hypothetical protein HPP92_002246 [Vanilla planifolia]|uniref:Uncharacterized protein n=1 Tax=Vanilla planifolia TaxID=51239 RepID=A0A835S194_VANPL|nr:hypothetical protein HPP92_002246 [Vanilla planifolia]